MRGQRYIQTVYADGIFKVGSNKYSKTFKFADINYSVSSDEDKKTIFLAYEELLNSFDSAATTKITVNNRKLNKEEFEKEILLENQDDGLDYLRKEYNEMLKTKVTASNALIQESMTSRQEKALKRQIQSLSARILRVLIRRLKQ